MKKAGYLDTSDQQTIDYNNGVDITDIEIVDYNNDTQINDLDDNITVDLDDNIKVTDDIDQTNSKKKHQKHKLPRKKIIGKYKKTNNSKLKNHAKLNKTDKDGVIFIKQVPVHQKNRFKKIDDLNDKVEFIKQVPVHPKDRLKKLSDLKEFIKQVPLQPQNRLERQTKKTKATPLVLHARNRFPPSNKLKR